MEQEPVYVPSGKLTQVCERVLGKILDIRQVAKEQYVLARVVDYNRGINQANKLRRFGKWLGIKPRMSITPYGMELAIADEISALEPAAAVEHPMIVIHQQYGGLEHETKDAMMQCVLNETVAVSGGFVRGVSHLGLPLDFMLRPRFGFYMDGPRVLTSPENPSTLAPHEP